MTDKRVANKNVRYWTDTHFGPRWERVELTLMAEVGGAYADVFIDGYGPYNTVNIEDDDIAPRGGLRRALVAWIEAEDDEEKRYTGEVRRRWLVALMEDAYAL